MKDYYKILEIKFGAKDDEIKKAYRLLVQKYHPDKHFGNKKYEELLKEINEAYSILNDILKKSSYDIRYKDYFFKQSSSTTNNTSSSENSKSNRDNKKEQGDDTNSTNKTTDSMNKETFNDKPKFYNMKFYRYLFLIIIVGIGFLIYKWPDISEYYAENNKKEKYEELISSIKEAKKFEESAITPLKIPRVTLETRWKDDLMYYKFLLFSKGREDNSYKKLSNDSLRNDTYFETRVKTIEKISIIFLDKDGFKIYTLNIPISDMTRILDNNGSAIEYSINSNISMRPELYKDFKSWELTYVTN